MDLPRSGSPEDVELVRIETNDFTLIMKGKPYHERYKNLSQYRQMDHQDTMTFSIIKGKEVKDVKVFDVDRQQLSAANNLRPIFFENGTYQLIVVPKGNKKFTFYHEHPSLREAISQVSFGNQTILMGNLQFPNEVGYSYLDIYHQDELVLRMMIEIFPVKLNYRQDYQKLLEDINREIYNLTYHFIRRTFLQTSLKIEGQPSKTEFYRLIEAHFEQFLKTLQRIRQQPHHQLKTSYKKVRGDQLKRQNARTRKYLRKHPHLFTKVEHGIFIYSQKMMPVEGLNTCKTLTYDTYENRYVKWMIKRLIHKLTDLLHQIISEDRRWKKSPDEVLIANIVRKISQLKQQLNHPFWANIGTLDRISMSLVLQMAPGYRDAFQIFLTVSRGLMLQGTFYKMSMKDIARLYEYWTFLKLNSILANKYTMLRQDLVQLNNNGLYVYLLEHRNAKNVFEHPVTKEKIILSYQHSHTSLPTTAQEPDMMLKIEKKGKDYTFNYIFDAKYRIDYAQKGSTYELKYENPGPMEEDINTMHRYRDAIVAANDGEYERTSFGAYVLFPWHDEHMYQQHHFYQSIEQVNIGGLPFLPDATKLVAAFVERLIDKSPEEIHQEGILPKGAKELWESTLDDKVLVGLVATTTHYKTFIQGKYYAFFAKQLRQSWHEVSYVALYLSKDVTGTNGVKVYGKINHIIVEDEIVYFYVNQWINLPSVIKPVGYGIGNYIITTLNVLKEAKELPELFMKKKSDMILWRMLRRIADQIKLELDATMMDNASRIMKYRIKDITVICDERKNTLFLTNINERKIFALDDLYKRPSYVFKQLVKMINRQNNI